MHSFDDVANTHRIKARLGFAARANHRSVGCYEENAANMTDATWGNSALDSLLEVQTSLVLNRSVPDGIRYRATKFGQVRISDHG